MLLETLYYPLSFMQILSSLVSEITEFQLISSSNTSKTWRKESPSRREQSRLKHLSLEKVKSMTWNVQGTTILRFL